MEVIDKFNKLTSGVSGRDKFLKIVQQACQVWEHYAKQDKQQQQDKNLLDKLTKIQSNCSLARKVFRLFRFLDAYVYCYRFFQKKSPWQVSVLDVLDLCKQVFLSNFFLLDNLNLLAKLTLLSAQDKPTSLWHQILHNNHAAQYTKWGIRMLVVALSCGMILECNKLYSNYVQYQRDYKTQYAKLVESSVQKQQQQALFDEYKYQQFKIVRKQCINLCDFFGCVNALGYLKFIHHGYNGMLGVMSGFLGETELWP